MPSINKIQLLIGDHGYYFNENIGNILDIKVKKYLKNLVYTRDQYILNSYKLSQSVIGCIIMLLFSLFSKQT